MTTTFRPRCRARGLRSVLVALVALGASIWLGATPAGAGGWAVTSLDELPAVSAGEPVDVGFTIRQHGVRPVEPEGQVGIEVRDASGARELFEARPEGATGHYVTTVRVARSGTSRWSVHQGWFGRRDLGPIEVGSRTRPVAAGEPGEGTETTGGPIGAGLLEARIVSGVVGAAFAVLAVVLMVRDRRRALHLPAT